jgi:hypothetical protein
MYYSDHVNEPSIILLLLFYPCIVDGCLMKYIEYRASYADLIFNIFFSVNPFCLQSVLVHSTNCVSNI